MAETVEQQNERISQNIREYGWHCLHIFPTQDDQINFSYSVGFSESYGAPEVLIFGLEREKAHALLNECANLLKSGHVIKPDVEDGDVLAGGYNVVFKPIRSEHFSEYLGIASRYYNDKRFGAVVMFLPDKLHRFPWDTGYDGSPADESLGIV